MSDDILHYTQDRLSDYIREAKKMVENCEDAQEHLRAERFIYVAIYDSLWADYGEQTVEYYGKFDEDIWTVISKVEEKFKSVNNRSDVQADRKYFVEFWNNIRIDITQFVKGKKK